MVRRALLNMFCEPNLLIAPPVISKLSCWLLDAANVLALILGFNLGFKGYSPSRPDSQKAAKYTHVSQMNRRTCKERLKVIEAIGSSAPETGRLEKATHEVLQITKRQFSARAHAQVKSSILGVTGNAHRASFQMSVRVRNERFSLSVNRGKRRSQADRRNSQRPFCAVKKFEHRASLLVALTA